MLIKSFNEFLLEKFEDEFPALKKIYLVTKRASGHRWLSYKGFAGSKFFVQVTERNFENLNLNKEFPVLNYQSTFLKELIEKDCLGENIYNKPSAVKISSKKSFHELFAKNEYIPKTVTDVKNISELKFPIIAKPSDGHSGIGIKKYESLEEFNSDDTESYDVFSEFIENDEEHRFFMFKGKPFFWMQRLSDENEKAFSDKDEKMNFKYHLKNVDTLSNDYKKAIKEFSNKLKDIDFLCLDIMKGKDGKIYIIESNTQPGLPFDSTVKLYKEMYEDFYGPIDSKSQEKLNEYSKYLIEYTLEKDKDRFSVEKKK